MKNVGRNKTIVKVSDDELPPRRAFPPAPLLCANIRVRDTRALMPRLPVLCLLSFPCDFNLCVCVCVFIRLFSITQLIADVFVKGAFTVTTLESPESVAVCVCVCGGFTHTQEELILV